MDKYPDRYSRPSPCRLSRCRFHLDKPAGRLGAIYRIAVQGWTKEEAVREMTEGGFGFHEIWDNLVTWINGLDFEKIRKDAGITNSISSAAAPDQP